MRGIVKLIYGIIDKGIYKKFNFGVIGNNGDRIYTIKYKNISAVISDSPCIPYEKMTKDVMDKYLFEYRNLIEKIKMEHTIVPIKFGTILENDEEVLRILEKGYPFFKWQLEEIKERIEIDVTVKWNAEFIFREILTESKCIQELMKSLKSEKEDEGEKIKIKIRKKVEKALIEKDRKIREEILNILVPNALDFRSYDPLDELIIINTAFLIQKKIEKKFDQAVIKLDSEYRDRIIFRCVGPILPYNFNTVDIKNENLNTNLGPLGNSV